MSTLIGVRPLSRSASVGIGAKDVKQGKITWVNIESSRVLRDISRHTTLGQVAIVHGGRYQQDTASVNGGSVTPRSGSLTLDISASVLTYTQGTDSVYTKGTNVNVAAATQAVTPSATLPQITAIGYNTSTPATPTAVALNGTAAATVLEARALNAYGGLVGNPAVDTTADRTWLALVWVPPSITTLTSVAATDVFTTGSAHGYSVGDPVWFSGLTGGAGLTANQVYYVASVPSTTTFTVSATLGGTSFDHTTNITAGTVQRQILAADVIDTRP